MNGGDGHDVMYAMGDEIPSGTGGDGNDVCYLCEDKIDSANNSSGQLNEAITTARWRLDSQFTTSLRFENTPANQSSKFKKRPAALVDEAALNYWLENRHRDIHYMFQKK
jgi:hypothetical protein